MNFNITNIGQKRRSRGGYCQPVNVTADGCAATITTRYDAVGPTNILTLAHYPMTVILIEYEM